MENGETATGAKKVARLPLRLPPDLHATLAQMAAANERSINGEIVFLLKKIVAIAKVDWHDPEFVLAVRGLRAALSPIMARDRVQPQQTPDILRQVADALEDQPSVLRPEANRAAAALPRPPRP